MQFSISFRGAQYTPSQFLEILADQPRIAAGEIRRIAAVPGLYYIPRFASDLEAEVLAYVRGDDIQWKYAGKEGASRRASHTGYDYDYISGRMKKTADIPPVFEKLARRAREACGALHIDGRKIDDQPVPVFNQCLVNEYIGVLSQGIGWHTDHMQFGPYIACYTFNSGAEMLFRENAESEPIPVYTEPGSLYIMTGPARWEWQHSMASRKSDPDPASFDRKRIPRGDRYSVTFRHYAPR